MHLTDIFIKRPVLATVVVCYGAYQLWRRWQNGWRFEAAK